MKKFLLCLAAVTAMSMNAEIKTVVYDFKNNDYGLTRQTDNSGPYIENDTKLTANEGTVITLTKNPEKNGWRLWSDGLRVYKNSDSKMTISTSTGAITKVMFKTKANIITSISGVSVSGDEYGVACNGNNIPLEFAVKENGAINTLTLTIDTEGTGTSTGVSAIGGGTPVNPDPEATVVKSIAETVKLENGTPIKVDYSLTVAFRSYNNVFCTDNAGDFIQLYGANEYEVNDVIAAGWEAKYELYGTTPEITPSADGFPAASASEEFTAKAVEAKDITAAMVNSVILVKDVNFAEATPSAKTNFTGEVGDIEFTFRNNYTLESVEAGKYDVEVVVSVYNGNVQLYPIEYTKAGASKVSAIETSNGVAEYYTLQGVKVANPENGLYIRVQNGKASKILVK